MLNDLIQKRLLSNADSCITITDGPLTLVI
jgi:hypothetical protein